MNVWYISKYAADPLYGPPGRQFFFSKHLSRKGADVTLVGSRSNGNKKIPSFKRKNQLYYVSEGVKGVILNGPLIKLGSNIKRIYSWIVFEIRLIYWAYFNAKVKPDVIIVSSLSLFTFLSGRILKKKFNCKLICEVRDIWPLTLKETRQLNNKNVIIKFFNFIEKIGYKSADAIVGTMGNLVSHVEKIDSKLINKVVYIPTGFDEDYYVQNDNIKKQLDSIYSGIPNGNFIVGYAGTIGLINCVNEIIDVAEKMRNENISFVLLGDGVLREKLESRVKALGLHNVIFGGYYPKNNIPYLLEKCNVLINPWLSDVTLYNYGVSPNKWIDYMYSGRPIIVALDGFKNIINEANCGVFVKAGDINAMIEAINNYRKLTREELDKIGKRGKEYLLENLTYDVLSVKYLSVIENL